MSAIKVYTDIQAEDNDLEPMKVVLNANEDDVYGSMDWPWGGYGAEPFLKWDEKKEGGVTHSAGWKNHHVELEREQIDDANVRDDIDLSLIFYLDEQKVSMKIDVNAKTLFNENFDPARPDFHIFPPNYGGDGIRSAVCEVIFEYKYNFTLTKGGVPQWTFEDTVSMDLTYYASVVAYRYPPDQGQDYVIERTEVVSTPALVKGSLNIDDTGIYVNFHLTARATDSNGPLCSIIADWGSPCRVAHVEEWGEKKELQVSGPAKLDSSVDEVLFEISEVPPGIGAVDKVEWIVSYKDSGGAWESLDGVIRSDLSNLVVQKEGRLPNLAHWYGLALEHGKSSAGFRSLEMKVVAKAYKDGSLRGESNTHTFVFVVSEQLQLTVKGPEKISPQNDFAKFEISGEGEGVDVIQWLDWIFSYESRSGEWVELEPVKKEQGAKLSDLQVKYPVDESVASIEYWLELASGQGLEVKDTRVMNMKVVVKAISDTGKLIEESNEHQFTVEYYRIKTDLPDVIDVYPTEPNTTIFDLDYSGVARLQKPITVEYDRSNLPEYLSVSLEKDPFDFYNLTITYHPTKEGPSPPAETTLKITVKMEENTEYEKEVKIRILKANWLIMWYIASNTHGNLESNQRQDVLDAVNAFLSKPTPKIGISIIIDLDTDWENAPLTKAQKLKGNTVYLLDLKKEGLKVVDNYGTNDMAWGNILYRFIDFSTKKVPSEHTQLILDDHGGGIKGIIWDSSAGSDYMEIPELSQALTRARSKTLANRQIDIIFFDACLMGSVEVLHHLRTHARYFISSERISYMQDTNYAAYTSELLNNPNISPLEYSKKILDNLRVQGTSLTYTVVDSTKLTDLETKIDVFSKELRRSLQGDQDTVIAIVDAGIDACRVPGRPFIDLKDFAQHIIKYVKNDENLIKSASDLIKAVESAVVYKKIRIFEKKLEGGYEETPNPGYHGLSIYLWTDVTKGKAGLTYRNYLYYLKKLDLATVTEWETFLEEYQTYKKTSGTLFSLFYTQKNLHLHVYDDEGRHVGFNANNTNKKRLDLEIPGAFYYDYLNGTNIIGLPLSVSNFQVVVDGSDMEETEETYQLTYQMIVDDEVVQEGTMEKEIKEDTLHSTPIQIQQSEKMLIGETLIESSDATSPEPAQEEKSKGIPGPPHESILLGAILATLLIWILRKREDMQSYQPSHQGRDTHIQNTPQGFSLHSFDFFSFFHNFTFLF